MIPGPSLKARALRLLAQREHSRAELMRKLAPHTDDEALLVAALDDLEAKGFIDEGRVAESVLHRRAARLGATRVRGELQAKGLSVAVVDDAVQQLRHTERDRAAAVWARKFGQPPADAKARAQQMRFLAARGFAPEAIRQVVPRVAPRHGDDDLSDAQDGEG
ncbi:MAG: hypothetical protein RL758_1341 [Pseudomonadota bacterium]